MSWIDRSFPKRRDIDWQEMREVLRISGASIGSDDQLVDNATPVPEVTESRSTVAEWSIPHWLVVIPLTLLAAYLILWKPRKTPANSVDGVG